MGPRKGLHQVIETEEAGVRSIAYRFLGQIGGRMYFAEVHLQKGGRAREISTTCHEHVSAVAAEMPEYKIIYAASNREYQEKVLFGIGYALINSDAIHDNLPCTITIANVLESRVDTTPETMAYTTVLAIWKLLNAKPTDEPYIENHHIHFPGKQPTIITSSKESA